jgi:Tfp pilus assembly protein PilN
MADIDMIPREYRDGVRARRTLRLTGVALALVVAAGVLGGGALRWRTAVLDRAATALQASSAQAQADGARSAALQADRTRLEQAAALLGALRRKGELAALAQGLDAALTDGVWLTGLRVERDIQGVAPATGAVPAGATAAPASAFTEEFSAPAAAGPAPAGQAPAGAAQTWRLGSSIELTGQATSYAAVTAFLATLGRQSGIAGLRLVSSAMGADGQAIDFRATGALVRHPTAP